MFTIRVGVMEIILFLTLTNNIKQCNAQPLGGAKNQHVTAFFKTLLILYYQQQHQK